jgi:AcrR family transcriptional regulator
MKNTANVKENIIKVTTELIEQNNGNISSITARMIAQKAGVGLGLINYHFGSKENLITTCVQRIIGKVIAGFDAKKKYATDKERLIAWATHVFNFLFEHSAISRVSILGDMQNYTMDCNSVLSQKGFMLALTKDIEDKDKPIISFILTATMQAAFLSETVSSELLGYDFTKQNNRSTFIERLVTIIFNDNRKEVSL